MELESILEFIQNKNILVTGATGFVAKSNYMLTDLSYSLTVFSLHIFVLTVYMLVWIHMQFLWRRY